MAASGTVRKLATAAVSFSAAVYIAEYLLPAALLPWFAGGLVLVAPAALLCRGDRRMRALLIAIGAALGFIRSWGHTAFVIEPARSLEGERLTIEARALDYMRDYGGYSSVYVRVTGGAPAVKALLVSYGDKLPALAPGDEFTADIKVLSASRVYGLETDRYSAQGIFLRCALEGEVQPNGRWRFAALYIPRVMARAVLQTADRIFPEGAAGFIKALLLGDKTELYADYGLYYALGRAGFMHVVAVSGMHIAYLLGSIRTVTGSRRRTALFGIPLLLVYILMTGSPPSILRAGFMQVCVLLAPLLRREDDAVTSLSASLALLLLANPSSAAAVGLQLSFAAMAGIILLTPRIYGALLGWAKKIGLAERLGRRALAFACGSLSSSLGSLALTAPLVTAYFGYISLVSILTNLFCLWAVTFLFIGGWVAICAGLLLPVLGQALAWCLACSVYGLIYAVRLFAGLPYAAVYTSNPLFSAWLALVYVLFLAAWLFRARHGFRPLIPACLSLIALCFIILVTRLSDSGCSLMLTALDTGQGQCVVMQAGSATVMVDCGGTGGGSNAGDKAASFVLGRCRRRVDALLITHLHADHANGVTRLLNQLEVGSIVLPGSADDSDGCLPEILAAAEEHGTEVLYIERNTEFFVGDMRLRVFAPRNGNSYNERGIIILSSVGDIDALITGDADSGVERQLIAEETLPDIEMFLAGHHGARSSTGDQFLSALKPELCVISVGWNHYGHPAPETLERLSAHNVVIRRTDTEGNIRVRVP